MQDYIAVAHLVHLYSAVALISVREMISISLSSDSLICFTASVLGTQKPGSSSTIFPGDTALHTEWPGTKSMVVYTMRGCDLKGKGRFQPAGVHRWCPAQRGHLHWQNYLALNMMQVHSRVSDMKTDDPSHWKQLALLGTLWLGLHPLWGSQRFCAENSLSHLRSDVHTHTDTYAAHHALGCLVLLL